MSRFSFMTWGILLILIGVQLNLVDSYVLTPQATKYWTRKSNTGRNIETVPGNYVATSNGFYQGSNNSTTQLANQSYNSGRENYRYSTPRYQRYNSQVPVYQSTFGGPAVAGQLAGAQKMLTPPSWFCWPPIFLGSVLFLYGAANRIE